MNSWRTKLWGTLAVAFGAGNILLHKTGNETFGGQIAVIGLDAWILTYRVLGVIGISIALFALVRKLRADSTRRRVFLATIPLMALLDLSLISSPVERIHYFQYGVVTWLAYRAIRNPLAAAAFAFGVNVIDESYQYWVLYAEPRFIYFDWNDIVLNAIGTLIPLLFFLPLPGPSWKVPVKAIASAVILWTAASALIVLAFRPDRYLTRDDPYWTKGAGAFWITAPEVNTHYHILTALEGLVVVGVIVILTLSYYVGPGVVHEDATVAA